MATCPAGHTSESGDYCDVCGERIGGDGPSEAAGPAGGAWAGDGAARPCPDCGTPGSDRFCEECGYDFATGGGAPTPAGAPAPEPTPTPDGAPAQAGSDWVAVVTADRDYYDAIIAALEPGAEVIAFPPYCPERRVPIGGEQVRIGRQSASRGVVPEIDLRVAPEDPGVSHVHAVLLARPGGNWVLVDPGSTNGTSLNGSISTIPLNVEVPVADGDRIHVGVWTTITLEESPRKGAAP